MRYQRSAPDSDTREKENDSGARILIEVLAESSEKGNIREAITWSFLRIATMLLN